MQYVVLVLSVASAVQVASTNGAYSADLVPPSQFVFTAAGDHGITSLSDASFSTIPATGAAFHLALGDLSYNGTGTEAMFCDYVTKRVGGSFPFELVSGNHEDGSAASPAPDGYIANFAACLPDKINSLPYASGYAKQYYFDYPITNPFARIVMISPDLRIDGVYYGYTFGNPDYTWLSNTIDEARNLLIPWIIVGMHKPCITMGIKSCEIGPDLMNLLIAKRVDLVLQGHDHNYQRSKQLTCAYVSLYDSTCVVDDGSDNLYSSDAGTVFVISGAFGGGAFTPVNATDPEAGYFAKAMGGRVVWGSNANGTGRGIVKYAVSAQRIEAELVITTQVYPGTVFSDGFSVLKPEPPNQPPTAAMTADPVSGEAPLDVSFDGSGSSDPDGTVVEWVWSFGDGISSTASTGEMTHTYGCTIEPCVYVASLVVKDDAGAISTNQAERTITVTVANVPPNAALIADPSTGNSPLLVNFNDEGSSDPDGTMIEWHWTFGDGTTEMTAMPTTSHGYICGSGSCIYLANLVVKDNEGALSTNVAEQTISVTAPTPPNAPPIASFTVIPQTGQHPLVVNFDGGPSSDSEGSLVEWRWVFGDGSAETTTSSVTSHTYSCEVGSCNYTATLVVRDAVGALSTNDAQQTISISSAPRAPPRPSEPWWIQHWYLIVAGLVSSAAIPIVAKKVTRARTLPT